MIEALTLLLLFQLAGEALVLVTHWPVPGPVVGMALLFLYLCLRGSMTESLRATSLGLLNHLALLFVPAGVGVMLYFDRVAEEWLAITVALLLSTVLTLAVTALVMAGIMYLLRQRAGDHG